MNTSNIILVLLFWDYIFFYWLPLTSATSLVTSIMQSFENKHPIHCSVIVWSSPKIGLSLLDFSTYDEFPIYVVNSNDSSTMKIASQICKCHIFLLNNLNDLKDIDQRSLVQSDGKYAIVVDYLDLQFVKRDLFEKKGFFQNILDVVIIVPGSEQGMFKSRTEKGYIIINSSVLKEIVLYIHYFYTYPGSGDKYTIYGRDPETETELKIMNIWKNGIFYWKNKKLFPDRMQNLAGRVLTATSFEYSPFIYKENPEDEKFQGYEVG